jgi:hypothetical protein
VFYAIWAQYLANSARDRENCDIDAFQDILRAAKSLVTAGTLA